MSHQQVVRRMLVMEKAFRAVDLILYPGVLKKEVIHKKENQGM